MINGVLVATYPLEFPHGVIDLFATAHDTFDQISYASITHRTSSAGADIERGKFGVQRVNIDRSNGQVLLLNSFGSGTSVFAIGF